VEVTIVSADIRGFTQLSSMMTLDDVTDMLGAYLTRLVPTVSSYGGYIDKCIGDQLLCVFDQETQYMDAIEVALEMQRIMRQVNAQRLDEGKHIGQLGIGIHAGEVVRGFVGSKHRMEYTIIGDAVNRACRYGDGVGPGAILISPAVFAKAWDRV